VQRWDYQTPGILAKYHDYTAAYAKRSALLMASAASPGRRVAVVPYTDTTVQLAKRLAPRCVQAGIEIALVKSNGDVIDVPPVSA
jgi:hypothetical protein